MRKIYILTLFFYAASLSLNPFVTFASVQGYSLPPIQESKAYKEFKKRPASDHSKLLYLIDRFQSSDLRIYYDGYSYKAPVAALIARYFLAASYKKETVREWIMRWCNISIRGQMIYVKFPDGKFRFSRDVLMDEWKALEKVLEPSL